jgi:cytochrome c
MKLLALAAGISAVVVALGVGSVKGAEDASRVEYYRTRVVPILQANCYTCHAGMNHKGSLRLDSKAGMIRGGRDGAVIVPGDPAKSLLVRLMRHEGPANDPMPMPSKKPKLSDADIAVVERWVKAGAVMPDDVRKP